MSFIEPFWTDFVAFFHDSIVLSLGILLFCGYIIGKLFERIKLPAITGYIVSGVVLGQSVTGLVPTHMSHQLEHVTEIALALIAITIGGEFSLKKIRRTGTRILLLTLFEALFAFIFVSVGLLLAGLHTSVALILGSISAATAPAATVVIIKELRARGDFIDYLYGIVAFDDAIGVILFGIVFAAVTPAISGAAESIGIAAALIKAVSEVLLSFVIGMVGGFLVHIWTVKKVKTNEILLISLSLLFIVTAAAESFHLSSLLAAMAMGATITNASPRNHRIFDYMEPLSPPIFAMFFILAGTEMQIHVFAQVSVALLGLLYLATRFMGKWIGINTAGLLTHTPSRIRRFLGFCLFPQAGVAIGLALFVRSSPVAQNAPPEFSGEFALIVNIVLLSVFINELIGPAISRFGIKKGLDL